MGGSKPDEKPFFDCLDLVMNLQLSRSTLDECYEITVSAAEFFACLED